MSLQKKQYRTRLRSQIIVVVTFVADLHARPTAFKDFVEEQPGEVGGGCRKQSHGYWRKMPIRYADDVAHTESHVSLFGSKRVSG